MLVYQSFLFKFSRYRRKPWWLLTGPSVAILGFGAKTEKMQEKPELTPEEDKKKYQDMVNHLYHKALEAMERRKYVSADQIFHEALDLSRTLMKEGKIAVEDHMSHTAFLYAEMGNNSLAIGNDKAAEKLFKEGIAVALQLGMEPNDNAIVEMSLKLADIYGKMLQDDLALSGYRFCIQEQSRKVNEDKNIDDNSKALLGMCYQGYGRYLSNKQRFTEAIKAFKKALEISIALHGEGNDHPLTIISDIGNVMILMEDYDEAETVFLDGIKRGKKINSEMLSALYCNLGALYLRMSKMKEAENACNYAFSLGKKQDDQLFMAMAENCLGKIHDIKVKEKLVK